MNIIKKILTISLLTLLSAGFSFAAPPSYGGSGDSNGIFFQPPPIEPPAELPAPQVPPVQPAPVPPVPAPAPIPAPEQIPPQPVPVQPCGYGGNEILIQPFPQNKFSSKSPFNRQRLLKRPLGASLLHFFH